MDKLEPTGIKLREDMLKQSKSHKKSRKTTQTLVALSYVTKRSWCLLSATKDAILS